MYVNPQLLVSYRLADLYGAASGFTSNCASTSNDDTTNGVGFDGCNA